MVSIAVWLLPRPAGVEERGWRLFAIFVGTIGAFVGYVGTAYGLFTNLTCKGKSVQASCSLIIASLVCGAVSEGFTAHAPEPRNT